MAFSVSLRAQEIAIRMASVPSAPASRGWYWFPARN